jgi:anti-sigma-K factor RskA
MSVESSHRHIEALLGAYGLDALDADESETVERHLLACGSCRLEVSEHRAIAASLVQSAEPVPSQVWDRLVAELEETPPALELAPIVSLARRRARTTRAFGALAAIAAAAVAVLGVRLGDQERRVHQLQTAMADDNLERTALLAVANPAAKKVDMRSPGGHVTGQVALLADGRGYLVADGLPILTADRTYQLWALVDGQRISAGTLGTHPKVTAFHITGPVAGFAITEETTPGVLSSKSGAVLMGFAQAV